MNGVNCEMARTGLGPSDFSNQTIILALVQMENKCVPFIELLWRNIASVTINVLKDVDNCRQCIQESESRLITTSVNLIVYIGVFLAI